MSYIPATKSRGCLECIQPMVVHFSPFCVIHAKHKVANADWSRAFASIPAWSALIAVESINMDLPPCDARGGIEYRTGVEIHMFRILSSPTKARTMSK